MPGCTGISMSDASAMTLRLATADDVPSLQRVRLAVRENRLSDPSRIGVDEYLQHLGPVGRTWVVADASSIVGFASGRHVDGNIWALFVDPGAEGLGVGSRLHDAMVDWLFDQGLATLWLTTACGTRAEAFYRRRGWQQEGQHPQGEVRLVRRRTG